MIRYSVKCVHVKSERRLGVKKEFAIVGDGICCNEYRFSFLFSNAVVSAYPFYVVDFRTDGEVIQKHMQFWWCWPHL